MTQWLPQPFQGRPEKLFWLWYTSILPYAIIPDWIDFLMSATPHGLMSYAGPSFHLLPPLATATDIYLSKHLIWIHQLIEPCLQFLTQRDVQEFCVFSRKIKCNHFLIYLPSERGDIPLHPSCKKKHLSPYPNWWGNIWKTFSKYCRSHTKSDHCDDLTPLFHHNRLNWLPDGPVPQRSITHAGPSLHLLYPLVTLL